MKRSTKAEERAERWTAAAASSVLVELEESGQSIAAFARDRGLHPVRLARWRKRLASVPRTAPAPLVPVTVNGARSIRVGSAGIVIETGAMRVEVHDYEPAAAAWIAELIRVMESRG